MKQITNLKTWMSIIVLLVGFVFAETITVDDDGPADFNTIQAAINTSGHGDIIVLQPGMYTGPGNRDIDFSGKAVTVRSTNPQHPSIVSETVIDCQGTSSEMHRAFRFHTNEDPNSVVDGLTLTGGYTEFGGAIYCEANCSPTIRNCIIRENTATKDGGGIDCITSKAVIINCLIEDNIAGVYAGGINCCVSSDLTVIGCTIRNNSAGDDGGGIQFCVSSGRVINCRIINNVGLEGGGIWVRGPVHISDCTIVDNTATRYGGAVALDWDFATVTNCILWNNTPDEVYTWEHTPSVTYCDVKGGYTGDGNNIDIDPCFAQPGYWHPNDTPTDTNDDFWVDGDYHLKSEAGRWEWSKYIGLDSTGDGFIDLSDFAAFANSWQTKGRFIPSDLDRSGFVDLSDLKLLLDNYLADYPIGEWVTDNITSPCIDAGDPNSDWTAELWPHGKRINMGAYGGIPQTSMSLSTTGNKADVNNDGVVNGEDLALFIEMWLIEDLLLKEDINRNGLVNFSDWAEFAGQWGWEE